MRLIKNITKAILCATLLIGCTRGGDQLSGSNDVYTVTATLSKTLFTSPTTVNATGSVQGIYDRELNSLTLDVTWKDLLEEGDALERFCFYKILEEDNRSLTRTIDYSSAASNGNTSIVLSGYKGLRIEEINEFMNGNWFLTLCTSKHPEGIIGGTLNLKKQEGTETTYVTGFLLKDEEESTLYVEQGGSKKVEIYVLPYYADNTAYTLESSDPSVFTVTQDGTINGIKAGVANLIIKAQDEKGFTQEIEVIVTHPDFVYKILFDMTEPVVMQGSPVIYAPTVLPETALNKKVRYESSDPSVVAVDAETGEVTSVSSGYATITATSTDGTNIKGSYTIRSFSQMTEYDRSNWIATATDENANGEGVINLLDGNLDTHWHNKTWSLPVSATVSLGEKLMVNRIEFDRRNNIGENNSYRTDTRQVIVSVINAQGNAVEIGTVDFGTTSNTELTGRLDFNAMEITGIILQITASNRNNRVSIAELRAYYIE